MIPWGWLIAAVILGASFGAFIMAQFAAKGQADRCAECGFDPSLRGYRRVDDTNEVRKVENIRFDDYLAEQLKDPGFRVAWEAETRRDPNLSDLGEEHNVEVD